MRSLKLPLHMLVIALILANILIRPAKSEEFTDALNSARRARGLGAVIYDVGLSSIAAQNNAQQAKRGQGHWVTGGYGQCAYVGPRTKIGALYGYRQEDFIGMGYVDSPSHAAILFHPAVKRIGVDQIDNRNTIVIAFDDAKKTVESKPATGAHPVAAPAMTLETVRACQSTPCPPPVNHRLVMTARGAGRSGFRPLLRALERFLWRNAFMQVLAPGNRVDIKAAPVRSGTITHVKIGLDDKITYRVQLDADTPRLDGGLVEENAEFTDFYFPGPTPLVYWQVQKAFRYGVQ